MSSKYKVNNHSVLNVSNDESKEGSSWHDIARRRAFSQHGDAEELPDGDIHKPVKHPDPHVPQTDPKETEEALHTIEDQIQKLRTQEQEKAKTRAAQQQQVQQPHRQSFEDDPHDDWYKE